MEAVKDVAKSQGIDYKDGFDPKRDCIDKSDGAEALRSIGSSSTSKKLKRKISGNNFSIQGATGVVDFETRGDYKGDRKDNDSVGVLVQVQPRGEGYDFFQIAQF